VAQRPPLPDAADQIADLLAIYNEMLDLL